MHSKSLSFSMLTVLVLTTLMLTVPCLTASAADELSGRLFTTAAERAKLDLARQRMHLHPGDAVMTGAGAGAGSGTGIGTGASAIEPESGQATLDGYVMRSSGINTTWVNQTAQTPDGIRNLTVSQKPGQSANISIRAKNGALVNLKVGDTLDMVTGKVTKIGAALPSPAAPLSGESSK